MDNHLAQPELGKVGLGGTKKRNFGNWFGERISEADPECVCVLTVDTAKSAKQEGTWGGEADKRGTGYFRHK